VTTVKGGSEYEQATKTGSSEIKVTFILGAASDGVFPAQETFVLELGPDPNPPTTIPPGPCNIVAIPPACFVPMGKGRYEVADLSCGVTVSLRDEMTQQTTDVTKFVTHFTAMMKLDGGKGQATVELGFQDLNIVPPEPCNLTFSVGNDGIVDLALDTRGQFRAKAF
jgi:hypothetical protein